jgi:outer membrane protein OmpA-like peptidoglycan-associated protein
MSGRLTACALAGVLSIAPALLAQPAGNTGTAANDVTRENVKTWVVTVDGRDYEVRPATPTYFGDTGLFRVSSAYTLFKGKVAFSLFRDNYDRDPKNIDFSVNGVNAAYGVTDRLEIFGMIGLQNRLDVDNNNQGGYFNDLPFAGVNTTAHDAWETGFGDIRIGAKYGFLDDHRGDPLGLAVKAAFKIPTADQNKGLGTGKSSIDLDVVASKSLGSSADIHGQIGYTFNSDPDLVNIGNALKLGVGVNIPTCRIFQVQAELLYTKYQDYLDTAGNNQTNPLDFVVGPVFWLKPGFFIRPALSGNLNFDDRGANSSTASWLGRQIEIGYHPGTICHKIATPPPPVVTPAPANRPPTVNCDIDKTEVNPGESAKCHATGSDPDGDKLTYEWSASAGKVTGTGPDAVWDSTGVEPGTTATITVHVSDGRGGTAQATCSVKVTKKGGPPVTCSSGGFPVNRERLNNVDKACLDDVATRLKQDPRSRVVIIGHGDSKEKYPEVIGRKRAESAKAYLVKERGIDESRISVRSAAGRKPADTGTTEAARKKNRRVEIVFLTEGAELPE